MGKKFVYDVLLDDENLCNLENEKAVIKRAVENNGKLVIYGRRNSGKTSLVKNIIIPWWRKRNPKGPAFYVDLMGVKSLESISERFTVAFNLAYNKLFKVSSTLKAISSIIKGIKPLIEMTPDGTPQVSFRTDQNKSIINFKAILDNLNHLSKHGTQVLIVIDEFQDISLIDEAEAALREAFQNLDFNIPVLFLGSKQHMLSNIFQKPNAPFYNWGNRLEFPLIGIETYSRYMSERFSLKGIQCHDKTLMYIQQQLMQAPESINRLCSYLIDIHANNDDSRMVEIINSHVDEAIDQYTNSRQGEYEAYLLHFTVKEQELMKAISYHGVIERPQSKSVLSQVNVSSPGMRRIISKLLDNAVIYRDTSGYTMADPLLMWYLKKYRSF